MVIQVACVALPGSGKMLLRDARKMSNHPHLKSGIFT